MHNRLVNEEWQRRTRDDLTQRTSSPALSKRRPTSRAPVLSQTVAVTALLAVFALVTITSMAEKSATVDEPVNLAAGYWYLITNDHRIDATHPPLIRLIAAAPLLVLRPSVPEPALENSGQGRVNSHLFAVRFLFSNRLSPETLIFWGRIPIVTLSVLLGFMIFRWAGRLAGPAAGLIALALYTFDPNIIAHSQLVTTDLGVTLCIVTAVFFWIRYLHTPTRGHLFLAALTFALAQVAKFTALVLGPIFILLTVFFHAHQSAFDLRQLARRYAGVLVAFALTTAVMVFIVYGFEWAAVRDFPSAEALLKSRFRPASPAGRVVEMLASAPLPAYSYWKGLFLQFRHLEGGHPAYLLGKLSEHGWWYYFPVAFWVKTPVATMVLLLGAIAIAASRTARHVSDRVTTEEWMILIAAAAFFGCSLFNTVNIGLRYILPVYPLLFVFTAIQIGKAYELLGKRGHAYAAVTALFVAYLIISSVRVFPHYLAYFNEIAGGPNNGWRYLAGSNLDWGQDLRGLIKYLKATRVHRVYLISPGGGTEPDFTQGASGNVEAVQLRMHGIVPEPVPDTAEVARIGIPRGVVAVRLSYLQVGGPRWDWLWRFQPTAQIGHSIWVFDFRQKQ